MRGCVTPAHSFWPLAIQQNPFVNYLSTVGKWGAALMVNPDVGQRQTGIGSDTPDTRFVAGLPDGIGTV